MYSKQRRTATYGFLSVKRKIQEESRCRAGAGIVRFYTPHRNGRRKKRQGAVELGRSPWKIAVVACDEC